MPFLLPHLSTTCDDSQMFKHGRSQKTYEITLKTKQHPCYKSFVKTRYVWIFTSLLQGTYWSIFKLLLTVGHIVWNAHAVLRTHCNKSGYNFLLCHTKLKWNWHIFIQEVKPPDLFTICFPFFIYNTDVCFLDFYSSFLLLMFLPAEAK